MRTFYFDFHMKLIKKTQIIDTCTIHFLKNVHARELIAKRDRTVHFAIRN